MAIIFGAMVPHPPILLKEVGKGEEEKIIHMVEGYKKAMEGLGEKKPDTVIIISPHNTLYQDYFHISPGTKASGSFARFGVPQVHFDVTYDKEFAGALSDNAEDNHVPAGTMGEVDPELDHGTMVPLYFLKQALGSLDDIKIVRIGLSGESLATHYKLGQLIKETAQDLNRTVAVIGSGDLSHKLREDGPYGFVPEGPKYDEKIMDVMGRASFGELFVFPDELLESAAECGHRSFVILAGTLDGMDVRTEALGYAGDFGVGYGICTYTPTSPNSQRHFLETYKDEEKKKIQNQRASESPAVALARKAIEEYVGKRVRISPDTNLPAELLEQKAGTFVTLKKEGQLRGCIGTISPTTENIAKEIIQNAISASTRDNRFFPVSPQELDDLVYSVDILGTPEPISSPKELDIERYGVIVTSGSRRGLLLPNLEGVNTVEEQIEIAREKAGISASDSYSLERFEVVRHH